MVLPEVHRVKKRAITYEVTNLFGLRKRFRNEAAAVEFRQQAAGRTWLEEWHGRKLVRVQ
jgi:hypothetical protein